MKDLIQSVINEEDNLIKELRHTSVITKEKLHNLKIDVTVAIDEICMQPRNYMHIKVPVDVLDHLEYTVMCTFEELEKLQQLDQSNHEEFEQKLARRQRKRDQKIEN
jgi:hypothetical protein